MLLKDIKYVSVSPGGNGREAPRLREQDDKRWVFGAGTFPAGRLPTLPGGELRCNSCDTGSLYINSKFRSSFFFWGGGYFLSRKRQGATSCLANISSDVPKRGVERGGKGGP